MILRQLQDNGDITLDVQAIMVGGRRYRVSTEDAQLDGRRDGLGANKRTGEFVERMVARGYTERQVRRLVEWYMRVKQAG